MGDVNRQELIERAEVILKRLRSPRHWLSTSRLADKLEVDAETLEEVLGEHARSYEWTIRYSYYPSRRSLEMLWGHRSNVGRQAHLPERERTDEPEEGELGPDGYESWVFLSHNRRDADRVRGVAEVVRDAGLGAWTFQEQIDQGKPIILSVRQAIEDCRAFLLYLSPHSLPSVWVEKESHFWLARHDHGKPTIALVDGATPGLFEAIEQAMDGRMEPMQPFFESLEDERRNRVHRMLEWLGGNRDRLRLIRYSGTDDSELRAALADLA